MHSGLFDELLKESNSGTQEISLTQHASYCLHQPEFTPESEIIWMRIRFYSILIQLAVLDAEFQHQNAKNIHVWIQRTEWSFYCYANMPILDWFKFPWSHKLWGNSGPLRRNVLVRVLDQFLIILVTNINHLFTLSSGAYII